MRLWYMVAGGNELLVNRTWQVHIAILIVDGDWLSHFQRDKPAVIRIQAQRRLGKENPKKNKNKNKNKKK